MVAFAGYELPVFYDGLGVLKEHVHCRAENSASLFDVSHMGQIKWHGKDAVSFVEKMVCGDIAALKSGETKLSLIMNDQGNIVDDTVITNAGDHIYMVVNGACKMKDIAHFEKYMSDFGGDVHMEYCADMQLLAVQGKGAKDVLARLVPTVNFKNVKFMSSVVATVAGIPDCRITRCGYTGEDGFEISVVPEEAANLAATLVQQPELKVAGLGARDSLRLEAGLCLYGNDLDETINPIEGSLVWTIGGPTSRRRIEQGFLGADKILEKDGKLKVFSKKRVGIAGMKAPARGHTEVYTTDGNKLIGLITSGGFGPTFGKPLAMGYVEKDFSKIDTDVLVSVRGKMLPAKISNMPFVPTNYFKEQQA